MIAQVDAPEVKLTWQDLIPYQIAFLQGEAKNDKVLVGRYKQWLAMLSKGYSEAKQMFNEVKRERDKAVVIEMLKCSA